MLGRDHAVSRASTTVRVLVRQIAATAGAAGFGVYAIATGQRWGIRLLSAAVLVEFALLAIFVLARQVRREHVLALIANGRGRLQIDEVKREVRRITTERHRQELATRLEDALEQALHWERLHVAYRPPPGVRALRLFVPEIRTAGAVRAADADVRGVALLELMLMGGYASVLYASERAALENESAAIDVDAGPAPRHTALCEQLWRVRHLLAATVDRTPIARDHRCREQQPGRHRA